MYSLRLLTLLASSDGHFLMSVCSARATRVVALPLIFLFSLSIIQGGILFGGLVHRPPVFVFCERMVVWVIWVCSLCLHLLFWSGVGGFQSPCSSLLAATLHFASWPSSVSKLYHTEVAAFQCGGLALSAAFLRVTLPISYLWPKAVCILCLVAFLV